MDRDIINIHEGENCPKRIVNCDFCEFPLPAVDLPEHQVMLMRNFFVGRFFSQFSLALILVCNSYFAGSLWKSNRTVPPL